MSSNINNNNNNNDDQFDDNNEPHEYWWWSSEAYAIKFAILVAIFALVGVYLLGGYLHAQKRMKKGLPLLAYHRWMVGRAQRARHDPNYQQPEFTFYQHQDGYAMHGYPPPPPAYNPNAPPPPQYQPPEGGSKINPSQTAYEIPPGAPPSSLGVPPPASEVGQVSSSGGFLSRFRRH